MESEPDQNNAPLFAPDGPLPFDEQTRGYLQIVLTTEGQIMVRGSRSMMEWLLQTLAEEGWTISLDTITWCG